MENTGSGGKYGVSLENTGSDWKTRGNYYFPQQWIFLVKKSQFCYFKLQWKSISVIRVFRSWKRINISWERNRFKCGAVVFFCTRRLFHFRSNLCGFIFLWNRNNEIIKIVLGILNHEKPFYTNNHFWLQTWTFSATTGCIFLKFLDISKSLYFIQIFLYFPPFSYILQIGIKNYFFNQFSELFYEINIFPSNDANLFPQSCASFCTFLQFLSVFSRN